MYLILALDFKSFLKSIKLWLCNRNMSFAIKNTQFLFLMWTSLLNCIAKKKPMYTKEW